MPSKKTQKNKRSLSPANRRQTRRTNPPKHINVEEGGLPTTVVLLGTPVLGLPLEEPTMSVWKEERGFPVNSAFQPGKESFRTRGWLNACTIM